MNLGRQWAKNAQGFTLLELAVVLAVVSLLSGLTLAAVSSAREGSRKAACSNNLRQIGLALQSYHDVNRRYPGLGYSDAGPGKNGSADYLSPYPVLLPFLGQKTVFERINFEKAHYDGNFLTNEIGNNVTAKRTVLSQLLCPSDGQRFAFRANANYAFSTGSTANGRHDGAFALFKCHSTKDIVDGLGQTAAASEIVLGGGQARRFSRSQDFWYSESDTTSYRGILADQMLNICETYAEGREIYIFRGYSWFNGGYENTWYNHVATPNSSTPDCSMHTATPFPPSTAGSFASRSAHGDGVHTAYLDGSVRWSASGIDRELWRAVGTRQGGEIADGL